MIDLLKNVVRIPFRITSSKPYTLFRILFESLDQTTAFYIDRARKQRLKDRQKNRVSEELSRQLDALQDILRSMDPASGRHLKDLEAGLQASIDESKSEGR